MIASTWRRLLLIAMAASCTAALAQSGEAAKTAAPKPDAAKGQTIASGVCAACHGADGNSTIAANPKLAQQHPEYLYKQLLNFVPATGQTKPTRDSAIMMPFAMSLSDADKRNVAAWFASQSAKLASDPDKTTAELGQRIWRAGIAEKSVPACMSCHAPDGSGLPIQYPRLGGQHADYGVAQLRAFRDGTRRNNVPMSQIAARLSEPEMTAVANYIQGLRR